MALFDDIHQAVLGAEGDARRRVAGALRAAAPAAALALGMLAARYVVIGGLGGYKMGPEQSLLVNIATFTPSYIAAIFATGVFDGASTRLAMPLFAVSLLVAFTTCDQPPTVEPWP